MALQAVEPLFQRLSLPKKVKEEAQDHMRLLDLRTPGGIKGPANACKYAVCIHIACRMHNVVFHRETALNHCGVDDNTFKDAYATVISILKLSVGTTFHELGEHFACPRVAQLAEKVFKKYKERFLESLPAPRRAHAIFDSPAYIAATFLLSAEFLKVSVHRQELLDLTITKQADLKKMYDSIDELIFVPLRKELEQNQQPNSDKPKKRRNRKTTPSQQSTHNKEMATEDKEVLDIPSDPLIPQSETKSPTKPEWKAEVNTCLSIKTLESSQIKKDLEEFSVGHKKTVEGTCIVGENERGKKIPLKLSKNWF